MIKRGNRRKTKIQREGGVRGTYKEGTERKQRKKETDSEKKKDGKRQDDE